MIIDVDAWQPPAAPAPTAEVEDDPDVEFMGFVRTQLQEFKQKEMDDNGFAFTGFDKRSSRSQTVPRPQTANRTRRPPSGTSWSSPSTTTASAEPPEVIVISDSDEEQGPPAKKRRLSPAKPATILPGTQTRQLGFRNVNAILRPAQPMPPVLQNRVAMECMRAADQDSEDEDFITAGLYPWIASGERTIAPRVHVDDEQAAEDLSIRMASLSVAEDFRRHPLERIAHLQEHYSRGIWQATATKMFAGRTFGKCQLASLSARTSLRSHETNRTTPRPKAVYSSRDTVYCAFQATKVVHQAPGDVNTIIQMGQTVIVASAVADGAVDDTPGAYNEKGSLGVWDGEQVIILDGHSKDATRSAVHEQRHYFTVNDVASNPNFPTKFVSAGRDNAVLFWDLEAQDGLKKYIWERRFRDNPEVVKYQPGGANLAVQCNDGAVYIARDDDPVDMHALIVAQPQHKHVTADMDWGLGLTENHIFASSACLMDRSGFHRGFDIVKGKAVMTFDAGEQACSTMTMDPFGDNLYIATEGADSNYALRCYDVRHRSKNKAAEQYVDLEPFAGIPGQGDTDINCLSVSSDGIYIAAGRTDNRLDVYDTRMLTRGALYNFSHEDGGLIETDSYGVVKVQWVDSVPYGTGFLSGGVDGCVRLWDMKYAGDDPRNGEVLVRCDYDVATFTLGNMYEGEAPIVVGERSGKVTMFGYQKADSWD